MLHVTCIRGQSAQYLGTEIMTGNLRRSLSAKIIECLNCKINSSVVSDSLASAMRISKSKGSSTEINIPLKTLEKEFPNFNRNLQLNSPEFPYVRLFEGKLPSLAIGVEDSVLRKAVLSNIINSQDLLKDIVNINRHGKLKVVVEFSSPNIAKPFHAGHLRSTILGNFVANIHEAMGHDVVRINYLGDWGTQFGSLIRGFQIFGDRTKLDLDPIQHLFEVYVSANKLISENAELFKESREQFRMLENDDESVKLLWQTFRDLSIKDLNETYKRLGVSFDCYEGESMYTKEVANVYDELQTRGLLKCKEDGTRTVEYCHQSGLRDAVLQKSDDTSLYLSRDIAAAISRMKRYKFDKMFYVVENGQSDHFIALFDILKQMGHSWAANLSHLKFGRIRGMSTRRGNVVFLRDILDEARTLTMEAMRESPNTRVSLDDLERTGDALGVASVLINDMRSRRLQDFDFSWKKVTQTKGDTGVFLLYVHARLCSLEENCGTTLEVDHDLSVLVEPEAKDLIFQLARYEEVFTSAYSDLQPSTIVQYLFALGRTINVAIDCIHVKGNPIEIAQPRLLLFVCARRILASGLKILGINPLRRM